MILLGSYDTLSDYFSESEEEASLLPPLLLSFESPFTIFFIFSTRSMTLAILAWSELAPSADVAPSELLLIFCFFFDDWLFPWSCTIFCKLSLRDSSLLAISDLSEEEDSSWSHFSSTRWERDGAEDFCCYIVGIVLPIFCSMLRSPPLLYFSISITRYDREIIEGITSCCIMFCWLMIWAFDFCFSSSLAIFASSSLILSACEMDDSTKFLSFPWCISSFLSLSAWLIEASIGLLLELVDSDVSSDADWMVLPPCFAICGKLVGSSPLLEAVGLPFAFLLENMMVSSSSASSAAAAAPSSFVYSIFLSISSSLSSSLFFSFYLLPA